MGHSTGEDVHDSQEPKRHPLVRWSILYLVLPYATIWFVTYVFNGTLAGASTLSFPLFSTIVPGSVSIFYRKRMREIYSFLKFSHVHNCPLCGEKIERTRFTEHLWLMPYAFKSLRHYESNHNELAGDAKRARLSETVFADYLFIYLGIGLGLSSLRNRTTPASPLDSLGIFLIFFLLFEVLIWAMLYNMLVRKKGKMLDP